MYTIKFMPYQVEEGYATLKRNIHVLPADEYSWSVRYPLSSKDLRKVLDEELEHLNWSVIWSLPLEPDEFPSDGIQVQFITTYKDVSPDKNDRQIIVRTYVAYDCSTFVMNDNGRTIDRIG